MRLTRHGRTVLSIHVAALAVLATAGGAQTPARVIDHILDEPGWLGIVPDSVNPLMISLVTAGTPAALAGLLPGDRITRIDGQVATVSRLFQRRFPVGEYVQLTVARAARQLGTFTLEAVENPYALARAREDSVRREAERYRHYLFRDLAESRLDSTGFRIGYSPRTFERTPLLAIDGKVAGVMVQQRDTTARRQQLVGLRGVLAEADTLVRKFAAERDARSGLIARIAGRTALAGAEIVGLNPELASYFDGADGVLVLTSPPQSAAARAGLRSGDVIRAVNDSSITTVAQLLDAVGTARAGIALAVQRRGERITVTLRR